MAETAFAVTYDGPALADARMPVRDLAPALLALGEVFTEASLLVYPDREPVALNVRAAPREGSFVVDLILQSSASWDQIIEFLTSDGVDALANLEALVIGGGGGLFWLLKTIRGRRVAAQEQSVDPGHVRITLEDGAQLEVSAEVLRLFQSIRVRKSVRDVVAPLTKAGVETLDFRVDNETTLSVDENEVSSFDPPEIEPVPLFEDEFERVVAITSLTFTEGNKWRFSDGESTFYAAIEDQTFTARVDRGEPFAKGDMLRCRMRIVQTQGASGLQTEYHVAEVLDHIRREPQPQLWSGADEPR